MELYIDPEMQVVIPPLTAEEQAQLAANLLAEGCRDPLLVWAGEPPPRVCPSCPPGTPFSRATALIEGHEGGVVWLCGFCDHGERRPWTLLDGHHRYAICQAHNLDFSIVEAPTRVVTREDAKIWIIQNQLGRCNLEDYQRGELALRLKGIPEAKAKAHQGTRTDLRSNLDERLTSLDSTAEMAKAAGLSRATMAKVKVIAQEADAPTKEALRRGERSIHRVYKEVQQSRMASNGRAVAQASSGPTTSAAPRRQKQLIGAIWQERLVEVRQHVMQLERPQLVENLARTWALDVVNGNSEELVHLIDQLRQVYLRIEVVICEQVDGDPQFMMARRLIQLADTILHELATWRQQFPTDFTVHSFGLMEQHLRQMQDYFGKKQRERIEHGPSVEVPTAGNAADIPLEEPTTEGDTMEQALSREHGPDAAADAPADAPIETQATDESPCTKTVLGSCSTRDEARIAARMWREKGRTVRVVHVSNDAAEAERPLHVVEVTPAGDSAGILSEAPTATDDELEQVRVADPAPHHTPSTTRPHAKKPATRARKKTSTRKGKR